MLAKLTPKDTILNVSKGRSAAFIDTQYMGYQIEHLIQYTNNKKIGVKFSFFKNGKDYTLEKMDFHF